MKTDLFKDYQERLNVLDTKIRKKALVFATEFYSNGSCTKAEAIERAIARAEIDGRNI